MKPISYKRHRFPAHVIRQAVWLYFRCTLSLRDVEDLLAERKLARVARPLAADLAGEHRTEPAPPQPHRVMADVDATLWEPLFPLSK